MAFAVFVIGSLLVLYIDSKFHKEESGNNVVLKSYLLQEFSVLVAEEAADLHLSQGTSNTISVEFLKDEITKKQMYKLVNDTLYVYGGLRTFVDCKKVKSIIAHKTVWFEITKFQSDSLNLDVHGGKVTFSSNEKGELNIGKMRINATDTATVDVYSNVIVDAIRVNATNQTNVQLYGQYKNAEIKIADNAKLVLNRTPLHLKLDRDESSDVTVYSSNVSVN